MRWYVAPIVFALIGCGQPSYVELEIVSDLVVGEQIDELAVTVTRFQFPDELFLDGSYPLDPAEHDFPIQVILEVVREPPDVYQFVVAAHKDGSPVVWGGKTFSLREGYVNEVSIELARTP